MGDDRSRAWGGGRVQDCRGQPPVCPGVAQRASRFHPDLSAIGPLVGRNEPEENLLGDAVCDDIRVLMA